MICSENENLLLRHDLKCIHYMARPLLNQTHPIRTQDLCVRPPAVRAVLSSMDLEGSLLDDTCYEADE